MEEIIYHTCRDLSNVKDKLSIAALFLFCEKHDPELFAELLYSGNPEWLISRLQDDYQSFDVNFSVRLDDRNVRECFDATRKKVIEKYDREGYFRAIFDGDEFALMCAKLSTQDVGLMMPNN